MRCDLGLLTSGWGRRGLSCDAIDVARAKWGSLPDAGFGNGSVQRVSETSSVLVDKSSGFSVRVIGIAHVGRGSTDEVREAFGQVRPVCVALDLCRKRQARLMGQLERVRNWAAEERGRDPTPEEVHAEANRGLGDVLRVLLGDESSRRRTLTAELLGAGLGGLYGVLRLWGFAPGQEFMVAMEEAGSMGINVELMDRGIDSTLERVLGVCEEGDMQTLIKPLLGTLRNDPLFLPSAVLRGIARSAVFQTPGGKNGEWADFLQRPKADMSLLLQDAVERVRTRSAAASAADFMDTLFPTLNSVILHERDEIMARHLADVTRLRTLSSQEATPGSALAIVGIGHLPGIEAWWEMGSGRSRKRIDSN